MMEENHCVYLKHCNNSCTILFLYVDEILITGNNKEMIDTTKRRLSSNFEMKDMGKPSYVLGMKIIRDRAKRILGLTQNTYIKKILELYHMQNSKLIDISGDKSLSLSRYMSQDSRRRREMSRVPYVNAFGSLMDALMCTRPNICYVVGLVSRYQSNPSQKHWTTVKRILWYLKGTSNYMLCYQGKKTYDWLITLMLIRDEMWTNPNQLWDMLSSLMIVQF